MKRKERYETLKTINKLSLKRQQEIAAQRVAHLPANEVKCRYCGEHSANNSFKGYAHKWGPTAHRFIAARVQL